jgi:hypothetical protein
MFLFKKVCVYVIDTLPNTILSTNSVIVQTIGDILQPVLKLFWIAYITMILWALATLISGYLSATVCTSPYAFKTAQDAHVFTGAEFINHFWVRVMKCWRNG